MWAALYDRLMASTERAGLAERRRRLLAGVEGRVLELGAGTGANLRHYAASDSVTVLEPDAGMRTRLVERVAEASVPVTVEDAALPTAHADASFDAVVTTLVLCTVPDPAETLAEIRRVLRPGGTFVFLEHVLGTGWTARTQHAVRPVWRLVAGGCHPDRDTVGAIRRAGFRLDDLERFPMPKAPPFVRPAVMGVAR